MLLLLVHTHSRREDTPSIGTDCTGNKTVSTSLEGLWTCSIVTAMTEIN